MMFRISFCRLLVASLMLSCAAATASAQFDGTRPRRVSTATSVSGDVRLENDAVVISSASSADEQSTLPLLPPLTHDLPAAARASTLSVLNLNQMLLAAIDNRLGARYIFGASGNGAYDCSGFVWSVFQSAGISFDRSSARTLWQRFEQASDGDKKRFGTLVFFNNLNHVGIVADEHSFYHASTTHGVTRSSFNDYWLNRLDGFRRVPLPTQLLAD